MAKIFLSFFNAAPKIGDISGAPPFYEGFIKGLTDNGNEVMVFQSAKLMSKRVVAGNGQKLKPYLDKFKPDLVIAFNNYGADYAKLVDCPIIIYGVDSPRYYYNPGAIAGNPHRYSYASSIKSDGEYLHSLFGCDISRFKVLPFFSEIRAENIDKTIPISFIGSRFAGKAFHWNEFRKRQPDYASAQQYLRLVNELRQTPYAEIADLGEKYGDLGLGPADYAGIISSLSAERRIQILSAVADLGLELFGPDDWFCYGGESVDLYCSYNPQRIYTLKQNQDLYNSSTICLNVNHLYATEGFSWRVCDIMASSGCLVSEWTPNLANYFSKVPIPMFRNKYEAHEQCAKVLKDDKLRAEVVAACQQAIDEKFRFRHVLPIIEEMCGMNLRSPNQGKVEFLEVDNNSTVIKPPTKFKLVCSLVKLLMAQMPWVKQKGKESKLLSQIERIVASRNMFAIRKRIWER